LQSQVASQSVTSEISMMLMCPWVCYLIAEGLSLSGIVAICTNGVFLNSYAQQNITNDSKRVLRLTYETVAVTAEQLVFLFLGIGLFAFHHPYEKMGVGFVIATILNLNFARFLNVMITTSLVNCSRTEKTKIPNKIKFIMWLSGLRGAMAYALALKCATDLEVGPIILIDTLIYAFITVIGVGSILNPILSKFDVKRKDDPASDDVGKSELELGDEQEFQSLAKRVKSRLSSFNRRIVSPIFIK